MVAVLATLGAIVAGFAVSYALVAAIQQFTKH